MVSCPSPIATLALGLSLLMSAVSAAANPLEDGAPGEASGGPSPASSDTGPAPAPKAAPELPAPPGPEPDPAEGEPAPDPPTVDAPSPAPIALELERAKEAYFDGGHEQAVSILVSLRSRIDSGEVVSRQTRGDIGIYLGELYLLLADQSGAWATFRWLLLAEPDYPILPALHPPEVVTWFEAVRAEVLAELEANKPPPPPITEPVPYPWWGFAPLGAPQFGQGHTGRGTAFALGQGASAGVSAGVFVHLVVVNRRGHPEWLTDDEVGPYVRRWRNGVQWPSTALFYGIWAASVLDGQASWDRAGRVRVVPVAGPDGAALHLGAAF